VTRELRALLVAGAALVLGELALGSAHRAPGLVVLFSLAGCAAIVLVSKWLGKVWLQRPEPPDE
jgi:hypothetical protein